MYYYIFGGIIILFVIWAIGSYIAVHNLEEPGYAVLEKRDGYEIRQYDPYIVAEATVTGFGSESINEGFTIVADYIFGNNTSKSKISMTTPVLEEVGGGSSEKIAMTVPVLDTALSADQKTIAFVLPSKYTLDTLPVPNNERVTIAEVPEQKMAAIRYTWYSPDARTERKKSEFLTQIKSDGLTALDVPKAAFYNPPLSMPLLLRNEILIPIE